MSNIGSRLREAEVIYGGDMLDRYVCDALQEMRDSVEHLNILTVPIAKRHLKSLIEEIQTHVNRMENALEARGTFEYYKKEVKALKEEKRKLEEGVDFERSSGNVFKDLGIEDLQVNVEETE